MDFQAKAQAATASFSNMNPAEALAKSLANDKPTIDSAIKAYMSITAARSWSTSEPAIQAALGEKDGKDLLHNAICSQEEKRVKCFFVKSKNAKLASLLCARVLSKRINSYKIPDKSRDEHKGESEKLEFQILQVLWNGIMSSGKKPTMILGRSSLCEIYPKILEGLENNETWPNGVDIEEALCFMKEFGNLLNDATKRIEAPKSEIEEKKKVDAEDDDSCLLWDKDGGQAELKRRRDRRIKNADIAKKDESERESEGLTIEEIED